MVDKEKRNKRNNKWTKENRERINMAFSIGTKDRLKAAADRDGLSITQFVQRTIDEKLKEYEI